MLSSRRVWCWMVMGLGAMLLGAQQPALGFIDFDAGPGSDDVAFTYSKETLYRSSGVAGFYAIGGVEARTDLLTRALIDEVRWLVMDRPVWVRYDLNEHLVFRGTAPRLSSSMPTPGSSERFLNLIPDGLPARNASTFAQDGFLLFEYELPEPLRPFERTPTIDLDLKGILATSGRGDGVLRVRVFEKAEDAVRGEDSAEIDKRQVVVPVAHSLRVVPRPVRQRAKALSGFLQFGVGARVPVAGFEIVIDTDHRQPSGAPVGAEFADLNVDVDESGLWFSGPGGFGFAPAEAGWTLEKVHPRTGLCHGDAAAAKGDPNAVPPQAPDPERVMHPVTFGAEGSSYPGGPAMASLILGEWHLCANVPSSNDDLLEEGDYLLTADFVPRRIDRPLPPRSVEDVAVGTVWRDGTTVHVPRLTTASGHFQELIVVNRHRRLVDYVLVVLPDSGGVALPRVIPGKLARYGPTRLPVRELVTLRGADEASAMLAVASFPNMIDVATTVVNQVDNSTDTVVLHRGIEHDSAVPPDPDTTTVRLPWVTTAVGTVQRLTIVNRLFREVVWSLTFHPEGDVTGAPEVVRGAVPPRGPTSLRIANLTNRSGGNHAAATLVLDAKPAYIDVSTTLVNRMDGSTDTVVLHRGIH